MRRILHPPTGTLLRLAVVVIIVALAAVGCGGENGSESNGSSTVADSSVTTATRPAPGSDSPGVFDDRILFGQSAAFSGLASQLGAGMKLGIEAAFAEANEHGGVHGRQLELTTLDDTYEPELAIANTTQLIEDGVFALIGAVGTPTSRSATPVAREAKVPYIAPFTGAAFLRDARNLPNVVNMRSSYNQETEEMVARLTGDLGITRIAVMYQDDSFGRAGFSGARAALTRRNMQPVSVGLYPRNTTAVKTGLLDLKRGDPQAVIVIGAYRPVASLIAWARHIGEDWEFMTVSFVGSNALAEELGPDGAGVYVTQVVPFPTDDSVPIVAAYLEALSAFDSEAIPGFVSLEGYLAGRLAIEGLERCGREVDRECFLEQLYSPEPIDLDGFVLRYGDNDNQGSDTVFLTTIGDDGAYVPISTLNPRRRASR